MSHHRQNLDDCLSFRPSPVVGTFWQLWRPPVAVNLATLKDRLSGAYCCRPGCRAELTERYAEDRGQTLWLWRRKSLNRICRSRTAGWHAVIQSTEDKLVWLSARRKLSGPRRTVFAARQIGFKAAWELQIWMGSQNSAQVQTTSHRSIYPHRQQTGSLWIHLYVCLFFSVWATTKRKGTVLIFFRLGIVLQL